MTTVRLAHPLARLAADLRAASFLLEEDDPLRGYLALLAALPPSEQAWSDVLEPWTDDLRRGLSPELTPSRAAAAGAAGVAALRAADEIGGGAVAAALRSAARWCFWLVRPAAA